MQFRKINKKFRRGLAIIVGEMEGNDMKTDGIVMHTAFCLSDNPQLICNATITNQDKIIYICGHGNAEKRTIGKLSMNYIASELI
ncbi:hypothetical protein [Clostridium ljungdahlii]|uniref:Uncharacterized protein n=1 Tax=Clostridium ljungdahlii TaxID=1538 RepID=A0A168LQM0_9CLOT|nr:hypothetical protein [Clostridium ljungdahlii]OAA83563.1 hypothetical protein WY13_03350 [Clostridium ljungdahlii]